MRTRRICLNCGVEFKARQYDTLFCSSTCRGQFNNRRQARGCELFDAMMCLEFDPVADKAAIRTHIKLLLRSYRATDKNARAGRQSWLSWRSIRQRLPGGPNPLGDGR